MKIKNRSLGRGLQKAIKNHTENQFPGYDFSYPIFYLEFANIIRRYRALNFLLL